MSVIDSDPVIVVDQGDDALVAITVPVAVSQAGVDVWELLTGPTIGEAGTKIYAGAISTVAGVTTATWTVPRADTIAALKLRCIARAKYTGPPNTYRTFYRSEFLVRAGLT